MSDRAEMEITVDAVKRLLDASPDEIYLVDCRREDEVAFARIDGAVHVPMERLELSAEDIADDAAGRQVVVYCHHGVRSFTAACVLRAGGVDGARSMSGGIDLWSAKIDPSVPTY